MNVIVIILDTLKRDHCGPYNMGKPLNKCWSAEAPPWSVPTPNMDRLAQRGVVFDNAFCGSTPCIPARRDIYTGRYEFLERGWGPLEEDDRDLPHEVSGYYTGHWPPAIPQIYRDGNCISYLVTDHIMLWTPGGGNYHLGYTGFEFIRGNQNDPWYTDPSDFFCPEKDRNTKLERYFRNIHHSRRTEEDYCCARVFKKAAEWLELNHQHHDFYLHIDCYDPHEPWDPPEELVKMFDPKGYNIEGWWSHPPYAPWREMMDETQFNSFRARYAAKIVQVDRWLGYFMDTMDRLDLWKNTLLILTTDHGTFNGDHGRIGKAQTHEFDAKSHIPFIIAHPTLGHGERRSQLVQLVDIYPTVLAALNRPIPEERHGINLLPILEDANLKIRDYAVYGRFGSSISITDGEWVLHQAPVEGNSPLYWYGYCLSKFFPEYKLGPYCDGKREVIYKTHSTPTWLSYLRDDPNELVNLATSCPEKLREMQKILKQKLIELKAPAEQLERLGLTKL